MYSVWNLSVEWRRLYIWCASADVCLSLLLVCGVVLITAVSQSLCSSKLLTSIIHHSSYRTRCPVIFQQRISTTLVCACVWRQSARWVGSRRRYRRRSVLDATWPVTSCSGLAAYCVRRAAWGQRSASWDRFISFTSSPWTKCCTMFSSNSWSELRTELLVLLYSVVTNADTQSHISRHVVEQKQWKHFEDLSLSGAWVSLIAQAAA